MHSPKRINCKVIVRVELIPDGEPEPPIYQDGRTPLAQFAVLMESHAQGFAFTGVDAAIPNTPPQLLYVAEQAVKQVEPTIAAFLANDKENITQMQYRQYDENNNFEVIADLSDPRTLN